MTGNDEQERQQLRAEIGQLRARLAEMERRLDQLGPVTPPPAAVPPASPAPGIPPVLEPTPPTAPTPAPPVEAAVAAVPPPLTAEPAPPAAAPRESFEVRLGTYWLPRLGITAVLIGMVFLVTWSYQYLGRGGKVALSYLCCAVLGGLGLRLERRTPDFARVLQAGALALTYFVTYAAHFVDTFRVIDSTPLGLGLLVVVVAGIVFVADRKQSATIAGLALFLGYFTSLMSGVTSFTLVANAVLAVAALAFLARNQWVPISYGAVFATYLAYMLWVWGLNDWRELLHLIFDRDYLALEDFRLRGGFLTLYWALFTAGGLLVRPDRLTTAERNGLLTLNNLFYFLLTSLLIYHASSDWQWQFQLLFAGALLVTSAIAYTRLQPDRTVMDWLFTQGVIVGSLGVINHFEGTTLVAVLAVEALLLLWLARSMSSAAVAWVGRVLFLVVGWIGLGELAEGGRAAVASGGFAALVGYLAARVERRPAATPDGARPFSPASLYFALVATTLLLASAHEHLATVHHPWIWSFGTVVVLLIGAGLRTREIRWLGLLPLAVGFANFLVHTVFDNGWPLAPSLALVALLFGYGLVRWGRAQVGEPPASARVAANRALRPFAIAAVVVVILATLTHGDREWLLVIFALETLVFVAAGLLAGETLFLGLALATLASGGIAFIGPQGPRFDVPWIGWTNLLGGLGVMIVAERLFKAGETRLLFFEQTRTRLRAWMVAIITLVAIFGLIDLVEGQWRTLSWALTGFVLMGIGFRSRERSYRLAGLAALGCSLVRAVVYDLGQLETPYRILSFIALGIILLLLSFLYARYRERLARWL